MITYDLSARGETPLYEYLYMCIRTDIETGAIAANEKLPSKRRLANHLGVSLITVEGAYGQLVAEGYLRSVERRGYYANDLPRRAAAGRRDLEGVGRGRPDAPPPDPGHGAENGDGLLADFRGTAFAAGMFPYEAWAKTLRAVLSQETEASLLGESHFQGSARLRRAIAAHLKGFRGMDVHEDQVFVGAGAQYLYHMIVQLLGRDMPVAVEDPGYPRLAKIYAANGLEVRPVPLDGQGVSMGALRRSGAGIAHIMPSHQYPTGQITSISRRYELLAWAAQDPGRVIVEDDFDCEFRLSGLPIPSLQSIDAAGQVVYANTFTKTLGPGFRLGYLVLPPRLAQRYRQELGFYSCTVGAVDQLALARFIETGAYERHVNRMRSHYRTVHDLLVGALKSCAMADRLCVEGTDAGLHFLMGVASPRDALELAGRARREGVALLALDAFRLLSGPDGEVKWFVMNYAGVQLESIPAVVEALERAFSQVVA